MNNTNTNTQPIARHRDQASNLRTVNTRTTAVTYSTTVRRENSAAEHLWRHEFKWLYRMQFKTELSILPFLPFCGLLFHSFS